MRRRQSFEGRLFGNARRQQTRALNSALAAIFGPIFMLIFVGVGIKTCLDDGGFPVALGASVVVVCAVAGVWVLFRRRTAREQVVPDPAGGPVPQPVVSQENVPRADGHEEQGPPTSNPDRVDVAALMMQATEAKRHGDWDAGIALLRQAYAAMELGGADYGIDPYLRLPQFLHAAGRSDEAFAEYDRILAERTSRADPKIRPMLESKVYDKMRLLHQRDGAFAGAVRCAALSYVRWAYGLFLQRRTLEFKDWTASGEDDSIRALLKKMEREDLMPKIRDVLIYECTGFPVRNDRQMLDRIDRILAEPR